MSRSGARSRRGLLRVVVAAVALAATFTSVTGAASADVALTGTVNLPGGGAVNVPNVFVAALTPTLAIAGSAAVDPASGHYSLSLAAGSYFLRAIPMGNQPYSQSAMAPVTVNSDGTSSPGVPIDFTLENKNFTGRVQLPDGSPSPSTAVVLSNGSGQFLAITQSFVDGYFTFRVPNGGPYNVRAYPPNPTLAASNPTSVTVSGGLASPSSGTLALRAPILTGRVSGPGGGGVPSAQVVLINESTHQGVGVGTNQNGDYAIDMPPGTYTMQVSVFGDNPSWLAMHTETITLVDATNPGHKDVSLVAGNVRGRLLAPDGVTPAAGYVTVFDVAALTSFPYAISTDSQGRFALTLTPPGNRFDITGNPQSNGQPTTFARATVQVIVGSGVISRDIVLNEANVFGHITKSNGTVPVANSFVEVRDTSNGSYVMNVATASGADGSYSMSLPPGTYDLTARAPFNDTSGLVNTTRRIVVPASGVVSDADISLAVGNVRGTVVAPTGGTPVGNSWVEVRDTNDVQIQGNFSFTATNGSYALAVPAGTYKLLAHPPQGSPSGWTTGSITVTVSDPATPLTGRTIQLQAANVTGTVRAGGVGIANAYVSVLNLSTGVYLNDAGSQTASGGAFALTLPNGSYRLTAQPPYNNANGYSLVTKDITVPTGGPVVIDLAAATIRGTVYRPDGTTPVPNANIEVRDATTGLYLNDVHANTGPDGSYGLNVPPGTYRITARPPWNGTTTDASASIMVTYDPNVTLSPSATAIVLSAPNVSGTVVAPDGSPIPGSFLDVVDANGAYVDGVNATTSANGTYGLNLPNGTYTLTARPSWNNPNGYVAGSLQVTLTGTSLSGRTISLVGANLTGKVLLPGTTTGVAYAQVQALDSGGAYIPGAFAQTRADGTYGLALPDGTYSLNVMPPWNSTADLSGARRDNVVVSGTTPNIDVELRAPSVTGRVCDPAGCTSVIPNSWVEVLDETSGQYLYDAGGLTRNDGTFALNVPVGTGHTFRLTANPSWNNPNNYTRGTATVSNVTGTSTTTQDVLLATATITGKVCQPGSNPCVGVPQTWVEVRQGNNYVGYANTSSNGSYGVFVPSSGTPYTIIARPPWNNTAGWAEGTLEVTYNGTPQTGQDVSLGTANVTGTVKSPDGSTPIRDAWVTVEDVFGSYIGIGASTSASGTFALRLPSSGTYTLHVYPSWNNAGNYVPSSTQITFPATTGLDLRLGAPNVTGRILPPATSGNTPVSGGWVNVVDHTSQNWVAGAGTASGGVYSLALSPGTYDVVAYPAPGSSFAPGRITITVVGGSPLTGQDVRLSDGNVFGTVTTSGGTPIANAFVQVYDAGGQPLPYSAATRSDGTYKLALPPGTYKLAAHPPYGVVATTSDLTATFTAGDTPVQKNLQLH